MRRATPKKTCSLRFPGEGGRCRRVVVDGDMCERHAQAYADVHRQEKEVRDLALELCCAVGKPSEKSTSVVLVDEDLATYRALYAANERLQSALVALHSRSGRDDEEVSP